MTNVLKEAAHLKVAATKPTPVFSLGEKNLSLGFDDEDGVGIRAARGAELLLSLVESVGDGGEDDAAIVAADKIEMALLLNEF